MIAPRLCAALDNPREAGFFLLGVSAVVVTDYTGSVWFLPAQEARAEACADDEVRGCSNASAEDNEGWGERRRREQVGDSGGGGYFLLGNMSAPGISS